MDIKRIIIQFNKDESFKININHPDLEFNHILSQLNIYKDYITQLDKETEIVSIIRDGRKMLNMLINNKVYLTALQYGCINLYIPIENMQELNETMFIEDENGDTIGIDTFLYIINTFNNNKRHLKSGERIANIKDMGLYCIEVGHCYKSYNNVEFYIIKFRRRTHAM